MKILRSAVLTFRISVFIALAIPSPAFAQRVALLIGNGNYTSATKLPNPTNDVELISKVLATREFSHVVTAFDIDRAAFSEKLKAFSRIAKGSDMAIIYYAGHGIERSGINWLIPVDASLADAADLPHEAVRLDDVLAATDGAHTRILVLDACRSNPFTRTWGSPTRAVSRGLAPVEADNTMVIFAAAPGQVAMDGDGKNSPFAVALAKRMKQSGLPIQLLGNFVRDDVLKATDGAQRPFVNSSIGSDLMYVTDWNVDLPPSDIRKINDNEYSWISHNDGPDFVIKEIFIKMRVVDENLLYSVRGYFPRITNNADDDFSLFDMRSYIGKEYTFYPIVIAENLSEGDFFEIDFQLPKKVFGSKAFEDVEFRIKGLPAPTLRPPTSIFAD